jgi:hypothetical protein
MSDATRILDDLLPLLAPEQAELHLDVAVLEASEPAQLVELASDPKVRRYLIARLSDTVALIDPGRTEALAKALLAEGHTPKRVTGTDS